jgi:predicted esterase
MRLVAATLLITMACSRSTAAKPSEQQSPPRQSAPVQSARLPAAAAEVTGPPSVADEGAALAPLQSDRPIVPLAVDGFPDAIVSIPLGATGPQPVVVATHGIWDFPEGLCDDQRYVFRDRAWVVCPRGKPMADKTFRYTSGDALWREIDADVKALEARFLGYVDASSMLYTGFSLGAILGVSVIVREPARFPRAVLIEGGEDKWTAALAAKYAHGGGRRVLFACGLRFRVPAANKAAALLERAGVSSHVVLGKLPDKPEFIHWYNGPIADETRAQKPWLFEGDSRWDDTER